MLSLIVARARNGAIGRNGDIPWHIPADLAFFKRETLGGALIMGRRTWESLPVRPLKNRLNLAVSSTLEEPDHVVPDLDRAIDVARDRGYARIYGIGGARIYRDLLPRADRLLITEVDLDVPDADTFFPEPEPQDWRRVSEIELDTDGPRSVVGEWLRR
ncbi:dihydrofolate reductase [Paracoccus isoporae]|uniref:Dihydrofolate reductase n=1 Tax=Paracoccus isoporae TaxID=591205 RepID=A0A1G7AG24_9RHOB|nr:dihydrofolate reductase [Paracoccus isoporae]SDE12995.1 dihydrofolate reductase [Paracoccus isoporae]